MADDDDLYDEDDVDDSLAEGEDEDEDEDSPFSEPPDANSKLPLDHPQFDGNIDPHELYDEGLDGAAEIDLPGTHIE